MRNSLGLILGVLFCGNGERADEQSLNSTGAHFVHYGHLLYMNDMLGTRGDDKAIEETTGVMTMATIENRTTDRMNERQSEDSQPKSACSEKMRIWLSITLAIVMDGDRYTNLDLDFLLNSSHILSGFVGGYMVTLEMLVMQLCNSVGGFSVERVWIHIKTICLP